MTSSLAQMLQLWTVSLKTTCHPLPFRSITCCSWGVKWEEPSFAKPESPMDRTLLAPGLWPLPAWPPLVSLIPWLPNIIKEPIFKTPEQRHLVKFQELVDISYREECLFNSVQFSRSVMFDSLWPRESQHARTPCPSPTPGVHSDSHPSSRWCHPAISSSIVPFSSCPQSLPASESFPMSQLFAWGGQSIRVSASASVLPMNT